MNNIYLVGMPGCGKSTIGNAVCEKIGIEIVDLDDIVTQREGRSIRELLDIGESYFRQVETEALRYVTELEGVVVTTGGGAVVKDENIDIMKNDGKVIFIDASPEFIFDNTPLERIPLLKDVGKIRKFYTERISNYRKSADYTVINNGILSDVCRKTEEVIRLIRKKVK